VPFGSALPSSGALPALLLRSLCFNCGVPSLRPLRLIAVRAAVAALVALAVLAWQPAVGAASQKVIESPGSPLGSIYVDSDLACQVHAAGDAGLSFFGGAEPGACGTFFAYKESEFSLLEGEGSHVFGPSPAEGVVHEETFEPINSGRPPTNQTLTGSGTEASPFVITTRVRVHEIQDEVNVAELTETDSYVTGQDFYTTKITIKNLLEETLAGTLYHAGDCFLSGLNTGYGAANAPSAGSVACTIDPGNSPPARFMAFSPTATSGPASRFYESLSSKVWSNINKEATQFPNTVDAATNENNGIGLSWPIELAETGSGKETATLTFTTTVSPSSPPTSSSTAGACVPSGQIPVTVSAANGAKAVDYVLDHGPAQSILTGLSGQATIQLTPGQHTLEYWGEDQMGAQEATHHVLSVTVASSGPSLTITSDQGDQTYEVGEAASVSIVASGPGLTSNPSAAHVPIATTTPGTFSLSRSAADACGVTEANFRYTVLPQPSLGKTVNAQPISGKVYVALPVSGHASSLGGLEPVAGLQAAVDSVNKGLHFIPLTEPRQLPVGTIFDTLAGVARVATAASPAGKLQAGDFGAGIFKLLQARKQKGLAELDIVDAHSARRVCASAGKKRAVVAKLSSKVLGRLNANAHGKFTTKGQYSAATVRGTVWSVTNRCDGTLTKVQRGVVSVRDFVRRKTITLFTGQHYLARP
jgi:hypothetical protein